MDELITIPADAIDDYQASQGRRGLRKRCGGEQRGEQRGKHGVAALWRVEHFCKAESLILYLLGEDHWKSCSYHLMTLVKTI